MRQKYSYNNLAIVDDVIYDNDLVKLKNFIEFGQESLTISVLSYGLNQAISNNCIEMIQLFLSSINDDKKYHREEINAAICTAISTVGRMYEDKSITSAEMIRIIKLINN